MRLQGLHWHPSSPSIPLLQTQFPNSIFFAVICDPSRLRGPVSTTRPPLRISDGPARPKQPRKLHQPSGPLFNSSPRSNSAFLPACSPPVAAVSSRGRQLYPPPELGQAPGLSQPQGVCPLATCTCLLYLLPLSPSATGIPRTTTCQSSCARPATRTNTLDSQGVARALSPAGLSTHISLLYMGL